MERWSDLQIETGVYIMRLDQPNENSAESTFTIWLSDFETLWSETITRHDLLKRLSDKNPTLATDDDIINGQFIGELGKISSIKQPAIHRDESNADDVKLQLKYIIFDEAEVEFEWQLKKCGPRDFLEQITKPLLRQAGELQDQKRELCDVATKKDLEIAQYKLELGQVKIRKRFITEQFDGQKFTLQSQMFNCEIDRFQSVIGLLPKNVVVNEPTVEAENNAVQPTGTNNSTERTNTSPRGKPNPRRKHFMPKLVRKGVCYEESNTDSDDDDKEKPPKRERRSSEF